MTKHQLLVDFDYDFLLIGIVCHQRDYRLTWAINKAFNIELVRLPDDLEIPLPKSEKTSEHALYHFFDEESHCIYSLVENTVKPGYVLPEHGQADFLLMLRDSFDVDPDDLIQKLKKIDFILTAYSIDVDTLKSKENLIF